MKPPRTPRRQRIYTYGRATVVVVLLSSALMVTFQTHQFTTRTTDGSATRQEFQPHASDTIRHTPALPWSLEHRVDSGVLVLNAPENTSRRVHYENLFRDIGYFHPIRFESACPKCEPVNGAIISHVRLMLRISQESHDKFILVFEDDVELATQLRRDKLLETLNDEIGHLRQPRDGFVYLGVNATSELEDACIDRRCTSSSLHAYMVTPWGARKILKRIEEVHGAYSPERYAGESIDMKNLIGPSLVLGWTNTDHHLMTGWRGLFYPERAASWWVAPKETKGETFTVNVAHLPKNDLLGSFVTPSLFLYAIASYHGWTMEIIPYSGSEGEEVLKMHLALGDKIDKSWGSGFQDASNRVDWDPINLNTEVYETMGFFPPISHNYRIKEWINTDKLPLPGDALDDACRNHNQTHFDKKECNLLLPDDPIVMERHMEELGGYDVVFNSEFRERVRVTFLEKNEHRLHHFKKRGFNVAIHIRRGDITADYRWTEQSVFARLARNVCRTHPEATIHVFSSGKNRDGNWTTMENVTTEDETKTKCASISLHLDELEFDSWAHMIAADVFIMSKSNFGLIPSLLARGEVYFPDDFWHLRLSSFRLFDSSTGAIIR